MAEKRKLPNAGTMITKGFLGIHTKVELLNCDSNSEFYQTVWTLKGKALKDYVAKVKAMPEDEQYKICSGKEDE